MLQAVNLTKCYGNHTALDGLNLEVKAGEIFCLLGANGAGKSTTINLFLNFIQPTDGEARIDGDNVRRGRGAAAYIPEQVALYDGLTGIENLDYFTQLAGKKRRRKDLLELLQQAGLDPAFADKPTSGYSKGMRQKVAVAAAMAREAKVMLLDEPTSGLDPKAASELATSLVDLKKRGTAVLMATHDLFRAREIAEQVGIMKHGRLVARVTAQSVDAHGLEKLYMEHMHD